MSSGHAGTPSGVIPPLIQKLITGYSDDPLHPAVYGEHTAGGTGIRGVSNTGTAVYGYTDDGSAPAIIGNADNSGPGILGTAVNDAGVKGFHGNPHLEETTAGSEGTKAGVFGASDTGPGVLGYSRSSVAGRFLGNIQVTGNVDVSGDVILDGADCAEQFEISAETQIMAGDVVVIDSKSGLRLSHNAYDRKVAGVVSGAGKYRPGILLDGKKNGNALPVALVGKVFCRVDADYSPVEIGDLLTTSPTPGHAMTATEPLRAFGAVLGKALSPLKEGRGLIPILVALQ